MHITEHMQLQIYTSYTSQRISSCEYQSGLPAQNRMTQPDDRKGGNRQ